MTGPRDPRGGLSRVARAGARRGASSRPGTRRSGRRPGSSPAAARSPLFTGRAVLLGALVLLLALTLAGPVRQWLAGRAEIAQLTAQGHALDQRVRDLQAEVRRQSDPDYIARQARERLTYVLPGDRLVVVQNGQAVSGDAGAAPSTPAAPQEPWYDGLLRSLAGADGAPSHAKSGGR